MSDGSGKLRFVLMLKGDAADNFDPGPGDMMFQAEIVRTLRQEGVSDALKPASVALENEKARGSSLALSVSIACGDVGDGTQLAAQLAGAMYVVPRGHTRIHRSIANDPQRAHTHTHT